MLNISFNSEKIVKILIYDILSVTFVDLIGVFGVIYLVFLG